MAAACDAVDEPPAFVSFLLDGSEERSAGTMRLDGGRLVVRYEWRVRREDAFAWMQSAAMAARA
jgi:hypothetical protein